MPEVHELLVEGLRREVKMKAGFDKVILGLSGGIDSAVVAALAVDAFGCDNVNVLSMPSRHSSGHSVTDAATLINTLNITGDHIKINDIHQAFERCIGNVLKRGSLSYQNIQARIRGTIIMTYCNHHGFFGLATGNLTEAMMGYCTLYGDTCGGIEVIGDLFKGEVFLLAEYINRDSEVIPRNIIDKAPSAELFDDQEDEKDLFPYPIMDMVLHAMMDADRDIDDIHALTKVNIETINKIVARVDKNKFKALQCPPSIPIREEVYRRMEDRQ